MLERPGALPPPANATVDIELTLGIPVASGDSVEVFDVGAWSAVGLGLSAVGQTAIAFPNTPYTDFGSLTGRPLDAIGVGDAVLALHYESNQLVEAFDIAGFAQTGS